MKREELVASFDSITPDKAAEKRMLDNILSHSRKERKMTFNYRRAIPALGLVIVIVCGILAYNFTIGRKSTQAPGDALVNIGGPAREDAAAPMVNQFKMDGRHYIILSDDLRAEYGFPQQISEGDIGEHITTITDSVDPSLIGCEVYRYKPAGSEAVVAVKKGDEYLYFRFFTFESYINNQDEDAIEYLRIYGINSAEDIAKIHFIVHSDISKLEGRMDVRAELTGRDEISRFYDYFSVLKNSSDRYFEKLFNYRPESGAKGGTGTDTPRQVEPVAPVMPGAPEQPANPPVAPVAPDAPVSYQAMPEEPYAPDRNEVYPVIPPSSAFSAPGQTGYAEDMPLTGYGSTPAWDGGGQPSGGSNYGTVGSGSANAVAGGTEPAGGIGWNPLADPVTIRIYNQGGVYLEMMYYRNIGFISRYEINDEFAAFINSCLE
ncbi:MAG TPA: hypothetical protein GX501_04770 [Clostridiaceae bacterium]|nr:hypothetical protein [Clostridiaceae bacterium]